jgi:hypothetical protein
MANTNLTVDQFRRALDEVYGHSERACVLLGAASVDRMLEALLRKHFQRCSDSTKEEIDFFLSKRPMPPLGSFAVRAKIARVLGLIDARTKEAIERLAMIRNDFAHEEYPKPLNAERVKALLFEDGQMELIDERIRKEAGKSEVEEVRSRFVSAMGMIAVHLWYLSEKISSPGNRDQTGCSSPDQNTK